MVNMIATFLDEFNHDGKTRIIDLVATEILGVEQREKIGQRYEDMKHNFNAYTRDGLAKAPGEREWIFSEGLTPWKNYSDTTSVPIPLTHPTFKNLREEYLSNINGRQSGAAVGHDLPAWFNLNHSTKGRIMIVAQDPLRNPKWYADCEDAVCSSPFGLHSIEWRKNGRGGKRLYLLISRLVGSGYGIYLTDLMKFYVKAENEKALSPTPSILEVYADILRKEIEIVKPSAIVVLGKRAVKGLEMLNIKSTDGMMIIPMPHFSGNAQRAINTFFKKEIAEQCIGDLDIETQAQLYYNRIIQKINGRATS